MTEFIITLPNGKSFITTQPTLDQAIDYAYMASNYDLGLVTKIATLFTNIEKN